MFEKMKIEGYHKYANAGHIAYIEFSSSPIHNLSAVESFDPYMKKNAILAMQELIFQLIFVMVAVILV